MCALFYFVLDNNVYGWWTGFHDYRYLPAYFELESFYSAADTVFLATEGSDLYGGWRYDYSRSAPALDRAQTARASTGTPVSSSKARASS